MSETLQIYVKPTSNYTPGLPLQTFERLGPEWQGDKITLPFGTEGERKPLEVVGWTDLFSGRPCPVHVVAARWMPQPTEAAREVIGGPDKPLTGYLVWGGNSGLRILDDQAEPQAGIDDWLPAGWGWPLIWLQDPGDLPPEVRAVVGELAQEPAKPGATFSLGDLAQRVTGGNVRALARMLNDAGAFPRLDEYNPDPRAAVSRDTLIDLFAQRAGDTVGHRVRVILSETMEG